MTAIFVTTPAVRNVSLGVFGFSTSASVCPFLTKMLSECRSSVFAQFLVLQVVYFYTDMDLILLHEVISQNPYRNPEKWPSVTKLVNAAILQNRLTTPEIAERTLKEHIVTLLKHFTQANNAQLKKQVVVHSESKNMQVCVMQRSLSCGPFRNVAGQVLMKNMLRRRKCFKMFTI